MKKVELLAPAGNMESLIAAVAGGCDAVYLGLQNFSARAFFTALITKYHNAETVSVGIANIL